MILNHVVAMYTETKHNWLTPDIKPIPDSLLRHIIQIVLKQTFFEFNNQLFTQNYGITMGAPSSVKLANITLHKHLLQVTRSYSGTLPLIQLRYIDDIFGLFLGDLSTLTNWVNHLNDRHNTIKFTSDSSFTHIPFLDTMVYIHNNKLMTQLYTKPTDKKQYLHFYSNHVSHIKKGIPYAQALRLKRIITDNNIFLQEIASLRNRFLSRSYPPRLLDKALDRTLHLNRLDLLTYNTTPKPWTATPFVLTFSNALTLHPTINIHKILQQSWLDLTCILPALKDISPPKIVFKNCVSITNLLVSNRFPPKTRFLPP